MNKEKVLITGASGLIGSRLTPLLQQEGYQVAHLSRKGSQKENPSLPVYHWDPKAGSIDQEALKNTVHIVHLAGAGIFDAPWTRKRREEIIQSRVRSAELLHQEVKRMAHPLRSFISASGINYYGTLTTDRIFRETDPPGEDFLAEGRDSLHLAVWIDVEGRDDESRDTGVGVCLYVFAEVSREWEDAADRFSDTARVVKIRTGAVLSRKGGALPQIMNSVRFFAGAPLGKGDQYFPWIHLEDIARIYLYAIRNGSMSGVYNGVAPESVTNKEFIKCLGKVMERPIWPIPVPGSLIRLALGKRSKLVLEGSRASCEKLRKAGFEFNFPGIREALDDLVKG